jgi:uncharacterized protein
VEAFSVPSETSDANAFATAVLLGEPKIVRSALTHGVDINAAGQSGTPPLVLAVAKGHEEIVGLLLEAGADVNRPDRDSGMTALHVATTHGHIQIIGKLISRGADVSASFGRPSMTALSIAFRKDYRDIVRRLLEAEADPNISINGPTDPPEQQGITPLHQAASVGDMEMLRLLIAHGADLDTAKADGLTPLMAAAFSGQFEAVRALVEAGAKVNLIHALDPSRPFSAVDLALVRGHAGIAEYLKGKGAIPTPRLGS